MRAVDEKLIINELGPYCEEARTARGRCAQLSSYAKSEITSLVPQAPSSFPSCLTCSASDGKLGGSLGTRLLMHSVLNVTVTGTLVLEILVPRTKIFAGPKFP